MYNLGINQKCADSSTARHQLARLIDIFVSTLETTLGVVYLSFHSLSEV